jgi:hypothetical protein
MSSPAQGKQAPAWRTHAKPSTSRHVSSRKHVLSGGSASALDVLLREWDKGKKEGRIKILRAFVARNQHKTGPELEMEYGNGASLFLTRVTAWLRLTYLVGVEVSLQLQAIHIFVSAASGHRFLTEFLEVGGVLTVLEILNLQQLFEEDVVEALQILHTVANTGRSYKELICEMDGVDAVLCCLQKSRSEVLCEGCRLLLITLGRGNPTYAPSLVQSLLGGLTSTNSKAQRIAAQTLRTLVEERATAVTVDLSWAPSTLGMMRTRDLQTQFEAFELIKLFLEQAAGPNPEPGSAPQQATSALLAGLVYLLRYEIMEHREVTAAEEPPAPAGPGRSIPADMKDLQHQILQFASDDEDDDDGAELEIASDSAFDDNVPDEGEYGDAWRPVAESVMAPVYTQQLGVARVIGMLSGGGGTGIQGFGWATKAREDFVVQHGGLGGLLYCLGTTESNEVKKQCAVTIASLVRQMSQYKVAVLACTGDAADGELLLSDPESFAESVDGNGTACEAIAAAVGSQASLGAAGGVKAEDQWQALPPMPKAVAMEEAEEEEEGEGADEVEIGR